MDKIKNIDWDKIIYNSGDVFLPESIKQSLDVFLYKSKNGTFYINGWTFIHLFSGVILGALYLYLGKRIGFFYYYNLLIIHTIWELWQMLIGMSKPWTLTGHSNLIDTFVDTFVFMFGAYISLQIYYIIKI